MPSGYSDHWVGQPRPPGKLQGSKENLSTFFLFAKLHLYYTVTSESIVVSHILIYLTYFTIFDWKGEKNELFW